MNWGYKILFAYLFFVTGILVLVYKSSSEKVDLVTKNYYQQELKYEQKIDEAQRAQSLSSPVKYELNKNIISISFPEEMKNKKITVQTLLYYPADESKDSVYTFETYSGKLVMVLPETDKGLYELKMDWQLDTTKYYSEHKVLIK